MVIIVTRQCIASSGYSVFTIAYNIPRCQDLKNNESIGGTGYELVMLESAHDSNSRLRGDPDHGGHVLPGHPNRQTNSVRILDSITGSKVQ